MEHIERFRLYAKTKKHTLRRCLTTYCKRGLRSSLSWGFPDCLGAAKLSGVKMVCLANLTMTVNSCKLCARRWRSLDRTIPSYAQEDGRDTVGRLWFLLCGISAKVYIEHHIQWLKGSLLEQDTRLEERHLEKEEERWAKNHSLLHDRESWGNT